MTIGELLDLIEDWMSVQCYYMDDPEETLLDMFLDCQIGRIEIWDEETLHVGLWRPMKYRIEGWIL